MTIAKPSIAEMTIDVKMALSFFVPKNKTSNFMYSLKFFFKFTIRFIILRVNTINI